MVKDVLSRNQSSMQTARDLEYRAAPRLPDTGNRATDRTTGLRDVKGEAGKLLSLAVAVDAPYSTA